MAAQNNIVHGVNCKNCDQKWDKVQCKYVFPALWQSCPSIKVVPSVVKHLYGIKVDFGILDGTFHCFLCKINDISICPTVVTFEYCSMDTEHQDNLYPKTVFPKIYTNSVITDRYFYCTRVQCLAHSGEVILGFTPWMMLMCCCWRHLEELSVQQRACVLSLQ